MKEMADVQTLLCVGGATMHGSPMLTALLRSMRLVVHREQRDLRGRSYLVQE